jgi:hypothetical protein
VNLCGAQRRSGGTCRQPAGWGTTHTGYGTCKLHPSIRRRLVDADHALGLLEIAATHARNHFRDLVSNDDLAQNAEMITNINRGPSCLAGLNAFQNGGTRCRRWTRRSSTACSTRPRPAAGTRTSCGSWPGCGRMRAALRNSARRARARPGESGGASLRSKLAAIAPVSNRAARSRSTRRGRPPTGRGAESASRPR